jgi:hypothetical protein
MFPGGNVGITDLNISWMLQDKTATNYGLQVAVYMFSFYFCYPRKAEISSKYYTQVLFLHHKNTLVPPLTVC